MPAASILTTTQLLDVLTEEITAREGHISRTFHDGERLFTRSVLPGIEEVRPGDRLQGGVALKATGDGVWLYPHVFRLVCRNGAIVAETLAEHSLDYLHEQDPETAIRSLRLSIAFCCAPEVFLESVDKMRRASRTIADIEISLLRVLSSRLRPASDRLVSRITDEFFREGDESQFGLANAVTAVARDIEDPDLRWDLEKLGGAIAVGAVPQLPLGLARFPTLRLGQALTHD